MFNVATNLVNKFLIGWPDQQDNFYLTGFINERGEPIISCRIFTTNGNFLFELEQNKLVEGSSDYWKRRIGFLSGPGWEVKDEFGNTVLETETINNVTCINGTFYDNKGVIAAEGDRTKGLVVNCPLTMG